MIVAVYEVRKGREMEAIFLALIASGVVALSINAILSGILPGTKVMYRSDNLVAMTQTTGIHGSFFLASGSINNTTNYKYYEKHADGGMTLETNDIQNSTIYYTTGTPRVDHYHFIRPNTFWSAMGTDTVPTEKFYVPIGSVTRDINLSIK